MSEFRLTVSLGSHEEGTKFYNIYTLVRDDTAVFSVGQYGKVGMSGTRAHVPDLGKKIRDKQKRGYRFDSYALELDSKDLSGIEEMSDVYRKTAMGFLKEMSSNGDYVLTNEPEKPLLAFLYLAFQAGQDMVDYLKKGLSEKGDESANEADRSGSYGSDWGAFA